MNKVKSAARNQWWGTSTLNALALSTAMCASAQGQNISQRWANALFAPESLVPTTRLCVQGLGSAMPHFLYIGAYSQSSGSPGGALVDLKGGSLWYIKALTLSRIEPSFLPTSVVNNADYLQGLDVRAIGCQRGSGTSKVQYFGGGGFEPISGRQDFLYTGESLSNDQALSVAPYPLSNYSCAAITANSARSLHIYKTTPTGPNPTDALVDTKIAPVTTDYGGSLVLAAGSDNLAGGVGGASAYLIKPDGSVVPAFTKTAANLVVNHVSTTHTFLWGGFSETCNVLIDNKVIHDATNKTYTYSFTATAYDGSGNALWISSQRPGKVFQVSVGSSRCAYTLATDVPGQVLTGFGINGGIRFSRSTKAIRLSAALEPVVVVGDNEIDATGHHHVHFTKYSLTGATNYTQTFSSADTNDDYIYDLQWLHGSVYIAGQSIRASDGLKGIFGGQYDQS